MKVPIGVFGMAVGVAAYHAEEWAEALAELRERFDVVICEGAGSPTEINLRAHDFVNMGLARRADIPVIVAGDMNTNTHNAAPITVTRALKQRFGSGGGHIRILFQVP